MGSLWTDPPAWSWVTFGVLCLIIVVLTVGFFIWMMLQPEEPADPEEDLVQKAVDRDRAAAADIAATQDADSGRLGTESRSSR